MGDELSIEGQPPKSPAIGRPLFVGLIAAGLALALASSACISDPTVAGEAPMCEETSDCGSGEVCYDGICFGNPPSSEFAAILVPSGESGSGLVQTAIPSLLINQDGIMGGLEFAQPVLVEGKVTLVCSAITSELGVPCGTDAPIDASIRVERAPAFPGGPRFVQTFTATADAPDGTASFSLLLPPTVPDPNGTVRNYQVTVTPLEPEESGPSAATVAPPRIETDFVANVDGQFVEWKLGEPDATKWIAGCFFGGASVPAYAKDLPVAAFAADPSGQLALISSRGRTDNQGCYSLRIPSELDNVNLRFEPDGDGTAPRVEVVNEPIGTVLGAADACFGGSPSDAVCLSPIRGPNLTNAEEVTVPITAQASEGGSAPVAGATVSMFARLDVPTDTGNQTRDGRVFASLDIQTTSSANANPGQLGQATAMAPVDITYEVSVVPSSESKFAARITEQRHIEMGGVQEPIFLGRRVGVSGQILDNTGLPITGATIIATPSVAFKFSQPDAVRASLDSLSAMATSRDDGTFFFWLEGPLNLSGESLGPEVEYDLAIVPPFLAGPPTRYRGIVPGTGGLELGELVLPAASFARGQVTSHLGEPARGVELHIWQPTEEDPCAALTLTDGECPAAATRIGIWLSNDDGEVRVVLPQ